MPVKPPAWIGIAMLLCGVACMFAISWPVASVVLTFTLAALAIRSIFPRGALKHGPDCLLGCGRIGPQSSRGEFNLPADVDQSMTVLSAYAPCADVLGDGSTHTAEVAASNHVRINCQESDAMTANDKPLVGGHSIHGAI